MIPLIIIIVFSIFFFIVGIAYLIAWRSVKDDNIFGAVIVMWVVVTLFLLVVYLAGKNRQAAEPAKTGFVSRQTISSVQVYNNPCIYLL